MAKDCQFCDLCNNWLLTKEMHEKHPQLNYTSMEDHLRMFHPNSEILDEVDFMIQSEEYKDVWRKKHDVPKRTEIYLP